MIMIMIVIMTMIMIMIMIMIIIITINKFWLGRWENVVGLTQTYPIWELEYQTSSFSATVLSINYIEKTHGENRCFLRARLHGEFQPGLKFQPG